MVCFSSPFQCKSMANTNHKFPERFTGVRTEPKSTVLENPCGWVAIRTSILQINHKTTTMKSVKGV